MTNNDDQVTLTVDGRQIQAPRGALLWEVCRAEGIDIPIFCYHTKLGAVGACRTCLVEQEGAKGPITACSTPVTDGLVIRTKSPVAQKAQRGILEFLLLNHPLDCPICDRGGECPLQDQVFAYGPGTSRYVEPKRHHVKPVALGPTIALDRERCVLCWRCVRFCEGIAEDKSIVLLDRGDHTVVGTFQDEPYTSQFSGNVIELCPVGALTSRKQRFNFRPWELQNRPSICPHCPMGCNINISVRKNDTVIRFLSRDNPDVDDSWLCDRGRFNYEFVNDPGRLKSPLIRREEGFEEVSWEEALGFIAQKVRAILAKDGPEAVGGIASPRLTNEDLYVFRRFLSDVVGTDEVDHFPRSQMTLGESQVRALAALEEALVPIAALDRAKTIVLLGADPSRREPVMELRIRQAVNKHGTRLVVVSPDELAVSGKAQASLPFEPARFSDVTRTLASAVRGASLASDAVDVEVVAAFARDYLVEGPVVVLYDDAFDGVADKGDALEAVAELVAAVRGQCEVGVIPMLDDCNSMGARDLGLLPVGPTGGPWGIPLTAELGMPESPMRALFVLGSNLVRDLPGPDIVQQLRALDLVVVHELALTETALVADVVLPASSFAEKAGTFTNTEGRIQMITPAVPSPGIARPDWEILVDLSQYLDSPLDYTELEDIWEDIRRDVPRYAGVSSIDIGPQGVRPAALQPA